MGSNGGHATTNADIRLRLRFDFNVLSLRHGDLPLSFKTTPWDDRPALLDRLRDRMQQHYS